MKKEFLQSDFLIFCLMKTVFKYYDNSVYFLTKNRFSVILHQLLELLKNLALEKFQVLLLLYVSHLYKTGYESTIFQCTFKQYYLDCKMNKLIPTYKID